MNIRGSYCAGQVAGCRNVAAKSVQIVELSRQSGRADAPVQCPGESALQDRVDREDSLPGGSQVVAAARPSSVGPLQHPSAARRQQDVDGPRLGRGVAAGGSDRRRGGGGTPGQRGDPGQGRRRT